MSPSVVAAEKSVELAQQEYEAARVAYASTPSPETLDALAGAQKKHADASAALIVAKDSQRSDLEVRLAAFPERRARTPIVSDEARDAMSAAGLAAAHAVSTVLQSLQAHLALDAEQTRDFEALHVIRHGCASSACQQGACRMESPAWRNESGVRWGEASMSLARAFCAGVEGSALADSDRSLLLNTIRSVWLEPTDEDRARVRPSLLAKWAPRLADSVTKAMRVLSGAA